MAMRIGRLPSPFASQSSEPLVNTKLWPSGDHLAPASASAMMLPNRRGEPTGKGTVHSELFLPAAPPEEMRSWEWSGEISIMREPLIGLGPSRTSPPFKETWAREVSWSDG